MYDLLSDEEIEEQLPDEWEQDGNEVVRTYEFDSYFEGVGFAAGVAGIAEEAFHHPDIHISEFGVEVRLMTKFRDAITEKDLDVAGRIEELR